MCVSKGISLLFACSVSDVAAMTDGALPFPIRGFMPKTNVINHMYLDMDLQEMLTHMLSFHTHAGGSVLKLDLASQLYEKGGHAAIQAELTVPELAQDMKAGEYVFQRRSNDWTRSARLRFSAPAGSTRLTVEYTSFQRPCFGGASNKSTIKAQYDYKVNVSHHCLDSESALRTSDNVVIGTPLTVSHKFLALAELSTTADHRMQGDKEFELRRAFYGSGDYAHLFIMNTFDENVGRPMSPSLDYRKSLGHSVGSDIVRKIIVFMSMHTEVLHQMSKAVQFCDESNESDCLGQECDESAMHAWEKAATYYSGSLWSDQTKSIFLDGNAKDVCRIFGTCDDSGDALVNKWIFQSFKQGQSSLAQGNCEGVIREKERIIKQMYVPVLQNLLRTAFALTSEDWIKRDRAHGVFFGKLIQPEVEKCDPTVAKLIAENVIVDKDAKPMTSGFAAFKRGVESLYPCFGVTCLDVGGILQAEQSAKSENDAVYVKDGEPCPTAEDIVQDKVEKTDTLGEPTANHAKQVSMLITCLAIATAISLP